MTEVSADIGCKRKGADRNTALSYWSYRSYPPAEYAVGRLPTRQRYRKRMFADQYAFPLTVVC